MKHTKYTCNIDYLYNHNSQVNNINYEKPNFRLFKIALKLNIADAMQYKNVYLKND